MADQRLTDEDLAAAIEFARKGFVERTLLAMRLRIDTSMSDVLLLVMQELQEHRASVSRLAEVERERDEARAEAHGRRFDPNLVREIDFLRELVHRMCCSQETLASIFDTIELPSTSDAIRALVSAHRAAAGIDSRGRRLNSGQGASS